MAGEYILKLLNEIGARFVIGNKQLVRWSNGIFTVYEHKKYAKNVIVLIETEDEELACKILKGE